MKSEISKKFDYLPIRQSELDWGMYVTVAGKEAGEAGAAYPQPGHPQAYNFTPSGGRILSEWQLLFIEQGTWRFSSQCTEPVSLVPGDVVILFPGVWHSYYPDPILNWSDYYMGFSGNYIFELCQNNVFTPQNPIIKISDTTEIHSEFESLLVRVEKSNQENSPRIAASAMSILALIHDYAQKQSDSENLIGERYLVYQAQRVIWGWSYKSLTVNKVAEAVNINLRTLQRYFIRTLGRSILDEIQNCRVTRATHFLQKTRIPITQVASMSGFSSPLHMRRAFHQTYNMSPEQFRKKQT